MIENYLRAGSVEYSLEKRLASEENIKRSEDKTGVK
jgi:hypothetical protein